MTGNTTDRMIKNATLLDLEWVRARWNFRRLSSQRGQELHQILDSFAAFARAHPVQQIRHGGAGLLTVGGGQKCPQKLGSEPGPGVPQMGRLAGPQAASVWNYRLLMARRAIQFVQEQRAGIQAGDQASDIVNERFRGEGKRSDSGATRAKEESEQQSGWTGALPDGGRVEDGHS